MMCNEYLWIPNGSAKNLIGPFSPESRSRKPECAYLALATGGDRSAFDKLVELYRKDLRSFVGKRVAKEDTDDIVQETWMAAWSSLSSFDQRSRFRTWLFSIANNKCRDYYRKREAKSAPQTMDFANSLEKTYEERAFREMELRSAVQLVLEKLSESDRELLNLYYFRGHTLSEVAKSLGRNVNTVKYQFYRLHTEVAEELRRSNVSFADIWPTDGEGTSHV